jgi:hypothetical protein
MAVAISCLLSPDGGIGRRAGLKHLWETVPVRLRLRVLKKSVTTCLSSITGFFLLELPNPCQTILEMPANDSFFLENN